MRAGGSSAMSTAVAFRSGARLRIQELTPWYNFGSVGFKLWPASKVLISYLETHEAARLPQLGVAEVGSGSGACGLAASVLGAPLVLLTDRHVTGRQHDEVPFPNLKPQELMLDLLRHNTRLNETILRGETAVEELEWGDEDRIRACRAVFERRNRRIGLVLGSDVTYHASGHKALFETVARLLAREDASSKTVGDAGAESAVVVTENGSSRFLFSHHHRSRREELEARLTDHAQAAGLLGPVEVDKSTNISEERGVHEVISVYECRLKD